MHEILDQLHQPEWWFTVVFAALFVGLFAAYLKDSLSALAARLSHAYKLRRDAAKQREEQLIARLAGDSGLLAAEYGELTFLTIGYVACVIFAVLSPAWGYFAYHFPEVEVWHSSSPEGAYAFLRWMSLAFGIVSVVLQYRLVMLLGRCREARRRRHKA
jgi:hypothetical protein